MSKEIDDNSIELMEQNKECLISHKISSPNGKNRSFSPFMIMSALSIHSVYF